MDDLLRTLIKGKKVTDEQIYDELFDMCDRVHCACDSNCIVYEINDYEIPLKKGKYEECMCFKNGKKMFDFIKERI